MFRRIVFWCHLATGVLAGLLVFVLCLTGAGLAFELQVVDWAERDQRARAPSAEAPWQSPAQIVAAARKVVSGRVQSTEWFADPAMPVRAVTDKREVVQLNPYTAEVLGRGAPRLRQFMRSMTELHTELTIGPVGARLLAWANVGFVFLILSGLWIWWPRVWRWPPLRSALVPRFDLKGKARDWNWHNALGFWSLAPLLFMAATGLVLSFPPVDQWSRGYAGTRLLGPADAPVKPAPSSETADTWTQRMQLIAARHPGWRSVTVPGEGAPNKEGLIACRVNGGTLRQARQNVEVKLDARTGQIVEERGWGAQAGSPRARSVARLGHSGELLGLAGQWIAFLGCLAGMLLVYTGFALSWRRFFGRRTAAIG